MGGPVSFHQVGDPGPVGKGSPQDDRSGTRANGVDRVLAVPVWQGGPGPSLWLGKFRHPETSVPWLIQWPRERLTFYPDEPEEYKPMERDVAKAHGKSGEIIRVTSAEQSPVLTQ